MVINKIDFPIYKTMIALAVILGALYIFISLKNKKQLDKSIIIFFVLYFILAIFTGKLYTYIAEFDKFDSFMGASLSAYGGLIGTIIGALIYELIFPKKGLVIKYTILALPLVYAFTKVGCFFNGCCYGIPYDGIFNITYPHVMNVSLFPIQFVEIIAFLILFLICNYYHEKDNIAYITLYVIAILKFLVEFLRYQETSMFMNPNQIFSIILLFSTIFIHLYNNKKANQV